MFAVAVLCALPSLTSAQTREPVRFLPFMAPQLEAARYSDANEEFAWVGWIGAKVDFVEKGKWSAYLNANVETILGHRIRSFEAVQANYSLEVGAHRDVGRGRVSPFFHHVSRHVQDRDKVQAVDWNFLGVRYDSPWPATWGRGGAFSGSFGLATLTSGVHYDFEARLAGDIDVVRKDNRAVFVLAALRHVGAESTANFPRESVTDVRIEAGVRRWTETSQFALFVAYQRRADALIPQALVTSRALFGFRIRGQRREAPALSPLP
ncbi:MAG: hypothetical protein KA385_07215 [Vicinamibacteria bacterium]|jgi:hypothetical protein|nr:hypothetical protein [Vicinamibacteria bacterium]